MGISKVKQWSYSPWWSTSCSPPQGRQGSGMSRIPGRPPPPFSWADNAGRSSLVWPHLLSVEVRCKNMEVRFHSIHNSLRPYRTVYRWLHFIAPSTGSGKFKTDWFAVNWFASYDSEERLLKTAYRLRNRAETHLPALLSGNLESLSFSSSSPPPVPCWSRCQWLRRCYREPPPSGHWWGQAGFHAEINYK